MQIYLCHVFEYGLWWATMDHFFCFSARQAGEREVPQLRADVEIAVMRRRCLRGWKCVGLARTDESHR